MRPLFYLNVSMSCWVFVCPILMKNMKHENQEKFWTASCILCIVYVFNFRPPPKFSKQYYKGSTLTELLYNGSPLWKFLQKIFMVVTVYVYNCHYYWSVYSYWMSTYWEVWIFSLTLKYWTFTYLTGRPEPY